VNIRHSAQPSDGLGIWYKTIVNCWE